MDQQKIETLCSDWRASIKSGDGFLLNNLITKHELNQNGIEPHLLDFTNLAITGSEIGKNLLFAKDSCYIGQDHYLFWTWTASLLLDSHPCKTPNPITNDRDIKFLLESCISTLLAHPTHILNNLSTIPQTVLLNNSSDMGFYLCFPLLESLSRLSSSEHLSRDGKVIKRFTIPKSRHKKENTYGIGSKCSRLQDALYLAVDGIPNPTLKIKTQQLIDSLENFSDNDNNGYEYLFDLRNSALHAGISKGSITATLVTISILLALSLIEPQYNTLAQWARINSIHQRANPRNIHSWHTYYAKIYSIEICCQYEWHDLT